MATALREAQEEVGLPEAQVRVVGRLPPCRSRAGLHVTPVVGLMDATFVPQLNEREVACSFVVPLRWFLLRKYHQVHLVDVHGVEFPLHEFFVPVDSPLLRVDLGPDAPAQRIWGMTAW